MAITSGIQTLDISDEQLAICLSDPSRNHWNLPTNTYAVFRTPTDGLVGPYLWNGNELEQVKYRTFDSQQFGKMKPKDGDKYQMAYMDSITRNELTFCTGPGGSGKSLLALGYAFQELEKGRLDRIIVFANTLVARNASRLGYYPGSRIDKLMDSSIGTILISKLGSRDQVQRLIDNVVDAAW